MRSEQPNRRSFLKTTAASFTTFLLSEVVFAKNLESTKKLLPISLLGEPIPGKSDAMVILNDKPWNAETPAHLLDPFETPNDLFFVRNNGNPPENPNADSWTLTVEGESVVQSKTYSFKDLKAKFEHHSFHLVIECGGNGRAEFNPGAKGNQWTLGAVGCAKWTGVKLKDILNDVGLKSDAVYLGYYGADTHLSGDRSKVVISRGVPIKKAMEEEALIAWAMNDEDLPLMNGYPLRLVFGGWPASTSGKWLNKIVIRNKVHDGAKMNGMSYRIPKFPVAPGDKVDEKDMKIIEAMPVKSIITYPKTGAMIKGKKSFNVRGHAWVGDKKIQKVEVSFDFGASWQICKLSEPVNKNAWQQFSIDLSLPQKGYYEIWAKASDEDGIQQPMVVPNWNPKGYLNNACHRIAVKSI